jgi:MFS-type transporter involved in bile tolerance (Atg22 family)
MSHDKIKAAARERMTHTGEPYATARREVVAEIRAAAAAHEELGPEYSDAVVASFLERIEEEIDARVDARMAEAACPPEAPAVEESRRTWLRGVAVGVAIGLLAAVAVGGNADERLHRRVLLLAAVAVAIAVTYAVSRVRAAPRPPVAPSARAGRTAR